MYVVPDSTIILLSGCPLNKNYEHTIYFDSVAEQTAYFMGLAKRTFDKCTYQRELRGRCSLQVNTADIYDCNYMMYQNSAYNNKWFYAFIDRVEWVNNANTNVYFTIDVMQTWFFDYDLQMCFVDREHSATDEFFEHTIPEDPGTGELIVNESYQESRNDYFDSMGVIYMSTEAPSGGSSQIQGVCYGVPCNMYVRCSGTITDEYGKPTAYSIGVMKDLQQFLIEGKQDAIQYVYQLPAFMLSSGHDPLTGEIPPEEPAEFDFNITKNTSDLAGYIPRNKKLFCYPYNFLRMSNGCGAVADYRFEDWFVEDGEGVGVCEFKARGVGVPNPQVVVTPQNYKRISSLDNELYDESLTISGYPPIPFMGDVLTAYLAMNKNSLAYAATLPREVAMSNFIIGMATGAMNQLNPFSTPSENPTQAQSNILSAFISGVGTLASGMRQSQLTENQQLAKQADLANVPNQAIGLSSSVNASAAIKKLKPIFYNMCVKPEFAKTIDDYFDRYGYKCNETKIPNRNVRPHWTYTKTVGCTINARCPSDDEETICQIYNKGITFWRNGSEVGDYSLDNTV